MMTVEPAPPPAAPPRWKKTAGRFVLTLEEVMCTRLRELPDWSSQDLDAAAENFLEARATRWAREVGDLPEGAEIRVLVDQFSRQAFLVHGGVIVHIESF